MIISGPVAHLLDRSPRPGQVGVALKDCQHALDRQVDMATHVLEWSLQCGRELFTWEALAISVHMHITELADAGAVLVGNSVANPLTVIVRAQFEALITLMFLLKDEAERDRRARSFLVADRFMQIGFREKLLKRAMEIEAIPEQVPTDSGAAVILEARPKATAEIATLRKSLSQPVFAEHVAEYERLCVKRTRPWYAMFNGPSDLRGLAKEVGLEDWYLMLYGPWSSYVHAESVLRRLVLQEGNEAKFEGLRNPHSCLELTDFIRITAEQATGLVQRSICPERTAAFKRWLEVQGRPSAQKIHKYRFADPDGPGTGD